MLRQLSIHNYAIIDSLQANFCDGVNIITGETGAGKSILLGALSLLLGERADGKALYEPEKKCLIEAEFDSTPEIKYLFEENDLDYDQLTIIRREIAPNGKSRAFVNDTPVNLSILKLIGEKLVNMHTQHETLDLIEAGFQLEVVDALAKNQTLLKTYKLLYASYKKDWQHLETIVQQYNKAKTELDFLQFQLAELNDARLEAHEQTQLEAEQQTLENVENIKKVLQAALLLINENEVSGIDILNEVQTQLRPIVKVHTGVAELAKRLENILVELKDIATEFEDIQEGTTLDPERLEEVNQRLSVLYRLQKKYNATTTAELINIETELTKKIAQFDNSAEAIEALKKQIKETEKSLVNQSEKLHQNRQKTVAGFEKAVEANLKLVGMPNATFKVDVQKLPDTRLNENGCSDIKFLFSANKGFAPQEIKEVASGGELSRLMLSIKSQLANADHLPTMIFDEIDSGISGEVALRVGEIMRTMSKGHQLICITHVPQIARIANRHFYIYKDTSKGKTTTRVKILEGNDRTIEIAKMLSGEKVSDAALANARELINT